MKNLLSQESKRLPWIKLSIEKKKNKDNKNYLKRIFISILPLN